MELLIDTCCSVPDMEEKLNRGQENINRKPKFDDVPFYYVRPCLTVWQLSGKDVVLSIF